MSVIFNQTNVAPGSAFASGGSGDNRNFPVGLTIGGSGAIVPYASGTGLQITYAGQGVVVAGGALYDNLNITSKDISWQETPSGTTHTFAEFSSNSGAAALTNISSINGAVYPPVASSSAPKILYGTVAFATNGQTVTFESPFASNPAVFLQATGNAAGVNGFFQVNNSTTYRTSFQILYSGQLIYGPIEMNWMAIGT